MRGLAPWAIVLALLWVGDIAFVELKGRTESGVDDVVALLSLLIFLLCPVVLLGLGIVALVRRRRSKEASIRDPVS